MLETLVNRIHFRGAFGQRIAGTEDCRIVLHRALHVRTQFGRGFAAVGVPQAVEAGDDLVGDPRREFGVWLVALDVR